MNAKTDEEKTKRIEEAAARFNKIMEAPRAGFGKRGGVKPVREIAVSGSTKKFELSGLLWIDPKKLKDNPYNDYPPLIDEELIELANDIVEKGVLVPLILRLEEDVIICGHNRKLAAHIAKESRVPLQRVLRNLSAVEERELMKSENDRRRGGNWSLEKKEEFIREHFEDELKKDRRGAHKKPEFKKFTEPFESETSAVEPKSPENGVKKFSEPLEETTVINIAKEIEKQSRGNIAEGTAKRIVAKIRKDTPKPTAGDAAAELSTKDQKRGEKLALRLTTLRKTRTVLEEKIGNVKAEEKRVIKELKNIGQPELFGV